jgi:hypothetical protein
LKKHPAGKKTQHNRQRPLQHTATVDRDGFYQRISRIWRFLHTAFNNFSNTDLISFFQQQGLETKWNGKPRIPACDKAQAVVNVLYRSARRAGAKLLLPLKSKRFYENKGLWSKNGRGRFSRNPYCRHRRHVISRHRIRHNPGKKLKNAVEKLFPPRLLLEIIRQAASRR